MTQVGVVGVPSYPKSEPAGLMRRGMAWLLDMALLAFAAVVLVDLVTGDWWFGLGNDQIRRFLIGMVIPSQLGRDTAIVYATLFFLSFSLFEGVLGTTPGKWLMGICLVRTGDRLLNPVVAGVRTLAKGAEWLLVIGLAEFVILRIPTHLGGISIQGAEVLPVFLIALLPGVVVVLTPSQRRLADYAVGTVVVDGRIRNRTLPPAPPNRGTFGSGHREAAAHTQGLAGDEAGRVGAEEVDGGGDVLGQADPPERRGSLHRG